MAATNTNEDRYFQRRAKKEKPGMFLGFIILSEIFIREIAWSGSVKPQKKVSPRGYVLELGHFPLGLGWNA
jgi:hypothetical protein